MTMTNPDPLVPRLTDPATSLAGVRRVKLSTRMVLDSARQMHLTWTDSELKEQVEYDHNIRVDRGHIARTRLNLERKGLVERMPHTKGQTQITFRLTPVGWAR